MIKINNLSKSFKANKKGELDLVVLNKINLTINDNDIYGIIGLSGAGKTTLIRILSGLSKPTSGSIEIGDLDITKLKGKELREFRKNLGVCFQGYNLLMQQNIYNNIAIPLKINKFDKNYINKRVNELLNIIGLTDKAKAFPATLSGGQCQRVAIARALATNPKILLLDEPTSALDPITTNQILDLLKEIRSLGITIIIITHEMRVIEKLCDNVAVLDKGSIVEQGKVEDIFNNPQATITKLLLGVDE